MPFMSSFSSAGQVFCTVGPALTGIQQGPLTPSTGQGLSQNQRSFKNPGTWAPKGDLDGKPKPPKSHFRPELSLQVMAKSLPPGVFVSAGTMVVLAPA